MVINIRSVWMLVLTSLFTLLRATEAQNGVESLARATRRCSNPPYVACAVCSTKPWPTNQTAKMLPSHPRVLTDETRATSQVYNVGSLVYYASRNGSASLIGSVSVQCLSNGSWSQPPKCEYYCTAPTVTNATCQPSAKFKANQKANCTCLPGYVRQTGVLTPKCASGNVWKNPLVCKPGVTASACNVLPAIYQGTCKSLVLGQTKWQKGEQVQCECVAGFTSYQETNSGIRRLRLRTTTVSRNNRVSLISLSKKNASCVGNNRWESLINCVAVTTTTTVKPCPKPPAVSNSGCDGCESTGNNPSVFEAGDSVLFECRPGYIIQGNPVVKCLSTGQWTKSPTCVKDERHGCKGLPVIAYGGCDRDIEDEEEDDEDIIIGRGQTITCQCDEDDATKIVTCLRNDTWSTLPTCLAPTPKCSLSSSGQPSNGHCLSSMADGATEFETGEKVTCSCDTGFYTPQNQSKILTCQSNGKWSADRPSCIAVQTPAVCKVPDINHGYCDESENTEILIGSTINCYCNKGYTRASNNPITCSANSQWSVVPSCVPIIAPPSPYDCKLPSNMTCSGDQGGGSYAGDSVSNCKCSAGFALSTLGVTSMICRSTSKGAFQWNPTLKCDPVQLDACNGLPNVENGNCISLVQGKNSWKTGEEVDCSCNAGYVVASTSSIRIAKLRATTAAIRTTTRAKRRQRRNAVFSPSPVQRAKCNGQNGWLNLISCQFVVGGKTTTEQCQPLPVVENAGCDECYGYNGKPLSSFSVGDTVRFQCNKGYVMKGDAMIRCLDTSEWTPAPTCNKVAQQGCTPLPVIPLGLCQKTAEEDEGDKMEDDEVVARGQTATCTCLDENSVMSGSSVVTCQQNDTWTKLPTCTQPSSTSCKLDDLSSTFANGDCISGSNDGASDVVVGGQAECECLRSFYLNHSKQTIVNIPCGANGLWSGGSKNGCFKLPFCARPEINHGYCDDNSMDGEFTQGETLNCYCDVGYKLSNKAEMSCTGIGTNAAKVYWNQVSSCVPDDVVYNCLLPEHVHCEGLPTAGVMAGNTVYNCSCEQGFQPKITSIASIASMVCLTGDAGKYRWSSQIQCISASAKAGVIRGIAQNKTTRKRRTLSSTTKKSFPTTTRRGQTTKKHRN